MIRNGNRNIEGFTLVEILIVMTILAILAATLMPGLIQLGADRTARLTATRANLQQLNHVMKQYRVNTGYYPERFEDLLTETYRDAGTEQPYLRKLLPELISSEEGNATIQTIEGVTHMKLEPSSLPGDGGWVYLKDSASIVVDVNKPLGSEWGGAEGDEPWDW